VPIKSGRRGDEILGYVMLGHLLDDQTSLGAQWNTVYENCRHYITDMSALNHQFFQLIPTSRAGVGALCHILQICIEHLLLQKLIQRNRDDLWQRAQTYIEENLREKLLLEDIAKALSVSVSTLNRCAEKNVKMAIGKYILQKRIVLACKYLKDPKHTIAEIATNCGIPDYNYFSRVFKMKTGMTPREYRHVFQETGEVPTLEDPETNLAQYL
jgi:AraC-like DNA-binding protein